MFHLFFKSKAGRLEYLLQFSSFALYGQTKGVGYH